MIPQIYNAKVKAGTIVPGSAEAYKMPSPKKTNLSSSTERLVGAKPNSQRRRARPIGKGSLNDPIEIRPDQRVENLVSESNASPAQPFDQKKWKKENKKEIASYMRDYRARKKLEKAK